MGGTLRQTFGPKFGDGFLGRTSKISSARNAGVLLIGLSLMFAIELGHYH